MRVPLIDPKRGAQGRYPYNFYFDPDRTNGEAAFVGVPGLTKLCTLSGGTPVRQLKECNGRLITVCGDTVYSISPEWGSTSLSSTIETNVGNVWIESNGTQIMITDTSFGYILEDVTVTKITDVDFLTPSSLTYLDTYFIVSVKDTGSFIISTTGDGTTWDALDDFSAQGDPDNLVAIIADHKELHAFGSKTKEVFQNTGNLTFTFESMDGGYSETGLAAAAAVTKKDNTLFYLTNNRQFVKMASYSPQIISTRQIDAELDAMDDVSDCIAFSQVQEGHTFVWFTFPTEDRTYVYDASNELWHRRTIGTHEKRHPANCYEYFNGTHVVGCDDGSLYKLDTDAYDNNGETIVGRLPLLSVKHDNRRLRHKRLDIRIKSGVGLTTGDGSDPQAILTWSDDNERTWSNERWADIGKIGKYETDLVWRRLGRSKLRSYELQITDAIEREIYSAHLNNNDNEQQNTQ